MGSLSLLQEIFPIKGSNLCLLHLLHWQAGSLSLHNPESKGVEGGGQVDSLSSHSPPKTNFSKPQGPRQANPRCLLHRPSWACPFHPWDLCPHCHTRVGGNPMTCKDLAALEYTVPSTIQKVSWFLKALGLMVFKNPTLCFVVGLSVVLFPETRQGP